jgi:hypothetical protein
VFGSVAAVVSEPQSRTTRGGWSPPAGSRPSNRRAASALIEYELDPNNAVIVTLADKAQLDKTFSDAGIEGVKIVEPGYK